MIGKTISHYKILRKIGSGGMGDVYAASDTRLKREVALKFLPAHAASSPEERARFSHEAQAAAALDHPNICPIHDIDEADGQLFIAMAYCDGQELSKKIQAGPIALSESIDLAIQLAAGLHAAHSKNVIHRDIKSSNVIVTPEGQVRILDFGLAKLLGQTKITKTGSTMGTVAYMSPEQTAGEVVDHRTDIWSLGVVLYEMIAGRLPFKGANEQAIAYNILHEDPEPLTGLRTGVPPLLEQTVNKCLAKNPSDRYQHADEVSVDLRRAFELITAKPSSHRPSRPPTNRGSGLARSAFVVMCLAILAFGGYKFLLSSSSSTVPSKRIRIAVIDVDNQTNEASLDGLSGMLITALQQSKKLWVLTRPRMFDVLGGTNRDQIERIDIAKGRDLARTENLYALVISTIRKFGEVYTLDIQVLDPHGDEYLFAAKEDGRGQESIPGAVDKLGRLIRSKLGELEQEIRSSNEKVGEITTGNMEAYRHYFIGEEMLSKFRFEPSVPI